ncbi:MAG: hypothetical protein WBR26_08840, partial [Candidatus Acidiferrum sp.]
IENSAEADYSFGEERLVAMKLASRRKYSEFQTRHKNLHRSRFKPGAFLLLSCPDTGSIEAFCRLE